MRSNGRAEALNARYNGAGRGWFKAKARQLMVGGACLFGSFSVAHVASAADACVEVDSQRDNLSESDRAATKTLLEQALIDNGEHVVASGTCSAVWRVFHVKLGSSVNVTVTSPQSSRSMRVRALEDIPGAYSQIVKALLAGKPLGQENATVDRTNVTDSQTSNNRLEADSLWYLRLGYGGVVASGLNAGPAFGIGWRKELDRIGIDASFFNFVATRRNEQYKDVSGSIAKLMVLYYFDPLANNSLYAGGGVSWGVSSVEKDNRNYTGSGLQGELSLGYEMLRASNIRLLVQLDASMPFYTASTGSTYSLDSAGTTITTAGDSLYTPTFALSLGLGWGKSNTLRVREVQ